MPRFFDPYTCKQSTSYSLANAMVLRKSFSEMHSIRGEYYQSVKMLGCSPNDHLRDMEVINNSLSAIYFNEF